MRHLVIAAAAAALVAIPSAAVAAPAAHSGRLIVKVNWGPHHRTETVHVVKNPENVRVQAAGFCLAPGPVVPGQGVRLVHLGSALYAQGKTRVACPHGQWKSAGFLTGWGKGARYHSRLGSKRLL